MAFHLFAINEVYSNADGSVQFVELLGLANGQEFVQNHTLSVTQNGVTHTFTVPSNLASGTSGKTVLFATPGFEALTGITPDYEIPAGFLFTAGAQTLNWAGADILAVPALPTDGLLSVGQNGTSTAINSPKNYAGVSGALHPPVSADLLGDAAAGIGQPFSLAVPVGDFTDADGDALVYTATLANGAALPAWLDFDDETLLLSGTPAGGDAGTIQVRITASDAVGSASDLFSLTVISGLVVNGDGDADSLTGGAADDFLSGFGGDDTLEGGEGSDILSGGAGNDTYLIGGSEDTVIEADAAGTDTVVASLSYTLGANVENLTLAGITDLTGTGNALDNEIRGNAGDNPLDGAAGSDTLAGGEGDDTFTVGAGDVVVEAPGEGHDTVIASVRVALGANVEDLVLAGGLLFTGSGNELDNAITGNRQGNFLAGGAGNDTLDGGARGDAMAGGFGDDTYLVDSREDRVQESAGAGDDTVVARVSFGLGAAPGVENLVLAAGASSGTGNALDNALEGNGAGNRLDGRAGDDTLIGGAGNDTLAGGRGADDFYFDTPGGVERIVDFESGVDRLVFDGTVFAGAIEYEDGRLFHDDQLIAVLEHAPQVEVSDIVVLV